MTKLQKSQIIYADLVYVLNKFGIDITSKEIESVIKGTIHSSLEKNRTKYQQVMEVADGKRN